MLDDTGHRNYLIGLIKQGDLKLVINYVSVISRKI